MFNYKKALRQSRLHNFAVSAVRRAMFIAWLAPMLSAHAASIDSSDFAFLQREAAKNGLVRVMVTLDSSIRLEAVSNNLESVKASMLIKEYTLRSELGAEALDTSTWRNGLGQIGLYVTAAGLKILSSSSNAHSFTADQTHGLRKRVHDADGSVEAIQALLNRDGYAEVEVFLNLDEGDYDIGKDGKTSHRQTPGYADEVRERINRITTHKASRLE